MFLGEFDLRPVHVKDPRQLEIVGLVLGQGAQPLEVLVSRSALRPNQADLRAVWKSRLAGRATPLLLVVLHGINRAALCGPSGDEPPVFTDIDAGRAERICRTALQEPDRHSALRLLHGAIPDVEALLAGVRNDGLFATHELECGVPQRTDWPSATAASKPLLGKREKELFRSLGFIIEPLPGPASILRASGSKIAIAVLLERFETPEASNTRFSNLSPISYALSKADEENLPYVMVSAGSVLRLYPVRTGVGIARRGRTETFIEVNLDLIEDDKAGFLWLLFSASALLPGGSFEDILNRSSDYAADLGERLRDRVYLKVVPRLAEAILEARRLFRPTAEQLSDTYQMSLLVLFRLLFVAYAEDKELLPYRKNELYRSRSLKQKSKELSKILESHFPFDDTSSHWEDCLALFRAVDLGKGEWGIPPYNGGLFASDPEVNPLGDVIMKVNLKNSVFGPVLADLLLDETAEGRGPVDFRSLGVREFGTIYEGLLENELSVADFDLAVAKDGTYKPARKEDNIAVPAGSPYLHNASGARKSTGSYFTKKFAVDHLLDHALEPALAEHIQRLDAIENDRKAAEAFFDFRVADIAMGSGHFLVAAVDRIERILWNYIARRPLPDVGAELSRLRKKALAALGPMSEGIEIEDTLLLRRQIARRCIFGVDINPLSVQLARLSIWVHTFVPGLPLSFLDHNLIQGNSLVGIATIEEAAESLREAAGTLFSLSANQLIGSTREAIAKLARLSDADAAEIAAAREVFASARKAAAPAEALFDIIAAARIDDNVAEAAHGGATHWIERMEKLPGSAEHRLAKKALETVPPLHFPTAFPEVFLRERAGFDVILGNPPWEEATVEEDRFWTRYFPGFHSLSQPEQEAEKKRLRKLRPDLWIAFERERERAEFVRRTLVSGPFPGMGIGDPDLYKAFAWRFWQLSSRDGGRIGVVLPRPAFSAKGSAEFRMAVFKNSRVPDLTTLLNNKGWIFEDVHPQYTIALVSLDKRPVQEMDSIYLRGPYRSMERYALRVREEPACYAIKDVMSWTDTAALPLLPDDRSGEVFAQLRKAPRLDVKEGTWIARPYTELHATNDKKLMKLTEKCPEGFWPVFKGESFDIWTPDTGSYYAWGDPEILLPELQKKRLRARSAFNGFSPLWLKDPRTLPCLNARIAFRDVTNRTNRRTVIAALVPPKVFITNTAPYLLWAKGDEKDQAYLLGVLCSIPLDWYARRFVEIHLNFFIFVTLPIPRPPRTSILWKRTIELAGRLACPDRRFSRWVKAVGVECGPIADDDKDDMIHELDAVAAKLYGLSEKQLIHIFETFHEGWNYEARLKATLRHFAAWSRKT